METSLDHADERDLIETFVERSRWHCRAARETFSTDEFRPVTTGAREYNLSVTARMLLIGESRFGVSCDFKVLAVAEMAHLTTSACSKTSFKPRRRTHGFVVSLISSPFGARPCVLTASR